VRLRNLVWEKEIVDAVINLSTLVVIALLVTLSLYNGTTSPIFQKIMSRAIFPTIRYSSSLLMHFLLLANLNLWFQYHLERVPKKYKPVTITEKIKATLAEFFKGYIKEPASSPQVVYFKPDKKPKPEPIQDKKIQEERPLL